MRTKAAFVVGAAVGYVLGTRAGRERFDELKERARTMWDDPRVQDVVHDLEDKAGDVVREKGPVIKDSVTGAVRGAAGAAAAKVKDLKGDRSDPAYDI